jgi:hypothetical protein
MPEPEPRIDPVTAESEEQDADLAGEHERTDATDDPAAGGGEAVPDDHGGMTTGGESPP